MKKIFEPLSGLQAKLCTGAGRHGRTAIMTLAGSEECCAPRRDAGIGEFDDRSELLSIATRYLKGDLWTPIAIPSGLVVPAS